MKKILLIIVGLIMVNLSLKAQDNSETDTVYLKNGSIIKGEITEYIPDKTVKINTAGGSLFVYKMSEVNKTQFGANKGQFQDVVELLNGSVIRGEINELIPSKTIKVQTSDGSLFVYKMEEVKNIQFAQSQNVDQVSSSNETNTQQSNNQSNNEKNQSQLNSNNYSNSDLKNKSTATVLSVLVTGAGHFYAGETGTGLLLLVGSVGSVVGGYALSDWEASYNCSGLSCTSSEMNLTPFYVGSAVSVVFWLYGVIDSGKAVQRYNDRIQSRSNFGLNTINAASNTHLAVTYRYNF